MGMKHSPNFFQRVITQVLAEFGDFCVPYLDNIWVMTKEDDMEIHAAQVLRALEKLTEVGFRINRDKCQFMKREFVGLGHTITHRGIGISPEICDEIMEFPLPQTYADLSTFLGKTGYVSEHIAGYQTLVHNLRQVSQEGANSGKSLKMTACHIRDFHKLKHAAKALTGVMVDPGRQQSVAAIVQPRTYEDLERFLKLTGVLA